MSKYHFILMLPLFLFTLKAKAQSKTEILALLKKYDTDGYFVISAYESAPRKYKIDNYKISLGAPVNFMIYVDSLNKNDLWDEINTVVHEMCHAYSGTMVYPILQKEGNYNNEQEFYALYRGRKNTLLLQLTETFPTKKIVDSIPSKLKTLRFETYIDTNEELLGAQKNGVYGLLEEWNAYYHGTKTSYLSYDYYRNKNNDSPADLLEYMQSFDGTFFAHAEFKFYILKYLLFARINYPLVFKKIMDNKSFRQAYKAINNDFGELIKQYEKRRNGILANMQSQGYTIEITEKWTKIGNSGIGNFREEFRLLTEELQFPVYQKLEAQIIGY